MASHSVSEIIDLCQGDEDDDITNVNFDLIFDDDDDDILMLAEGNVSEKSRGLLADDEKDKETAVDLEGIDFDEELEDAANISIGLESSSIDPKSFDCHDYKSGFDRAAGTLWIYPTNYPVRDYQYNIVQKALYKNTLVVLPTGLGKTFIAAVVMYNLYRWYPQGKIVFMAPTKPLVAQQILACYNIMGIPKADTVEMTGTMPPAARQKAWKDKRVVFLTPQVMTNDLSRGSCTAQSIKCLVVDEAHKALGNHAYCQVVRELVKFTREFRVLALSATPGGDLKAVQQVMNNLLISHIELRSEESIDIRPYTHERKVEKIVVPLGEELAGIRLQYIQIMNCVVQRLIRNRVLYNREATKLSKFLILKARDEFRQNPPQNLQQFQYGNIEADFALAMSLYHGFELLQLHGLRSLYNFLMGIISGEKGYGRTRSELMRNADFNTIMEALRQKFSGSGVIGASTSADTKVVVGHPKMQRLEEVVVDHFKSFKKKGEETRVMIFSQYRDSVQEISAILNQHQPLVKVMPFIGQSSAGKATKGYTQKEQLKVMRQFREGGYNTLVSTCVGEEGLDIGDVDLIVCFDAHKSPIRLVQRMGRTGRKRQGRIVMLVTEGKEEQVYNQSLYSKKSIHKAILNGAKSLHFYPNNPSMVPPSVTPQCHKMFITVAPALKNSQKASNAKSEAKGTKNRKISTMFQKQGKRKNDGYLTAAEYEEIRHEFANVPSTAKRLPKPRCSILSLKSKGSEKKSEVDPNVIQLSEWMPWQNRLQRTHIVGHSMQSVNLVKTSEFIEIQQCIGEEEDNYGNEMRLYMNKDDLTQDGSISEHGQSSIVSFFGPAEKSPHRTDSNQSKKQCKRNTGKQDRKIVSDSRIGSKDEGNFGRSTVFISTDSDLEDGLDHSAIPTKPKVSKLFTALKDSSNSREEYQVNIPRRMNSKKGNAAKSGTPITKRRANKVKCRNLNRSKSSTIGTQRQFQKLKQKTLNNQKRNGKRKSVLEILGSNMISSQDGVDFENGPPAEEQRKRDDCDKTVLFSDCEAEGVTDSKEGLHLDSDKAVIDNEGDMKCQFSVLNYGKSDSGSMRESPARIKRITGSTAKVLDIVHVPPPPPINEVKTLFANLRSESDFTELDLETLIDQWNKSEKETCKNQRSSIKEFMSQENLNMSDTASSCIPKKNSLDISCETRLLKNSGITPVDSRVKTDNPNVPQQDKLLQTCGSGSKVNSLVRQIPDGQRHSDQCTSDNKDIVISHGRIDLSPKSPAFKSLTSKTLTGRQSKKVKKSISFDSGKVTDKNSVEKENGRLKLVIGSSPMPGQIGTQFFVKKMPEKQCNVQTRTPSNVKMDSPAEDLNLIVLPEDFESTFDDSGNLSVGKSKECSKEVKTDASPIYKAHHENKYNGSFLTFTQALDCLRTSSSENSPEDISVSTPQFCSSNNQNEPTNADESKNVVGHEMNSVNHPHFNSCTIQSVQDIGSQLLKDRGTTTPQKCPRDSDSDNAELPQFDLGFELDDDIIPPTPTKSPSETSAFSFKSQTTRQKLTQESPSAGSSGDNEVTEGPGIQQAVPAGSTKLTNVITDTDKISHSDMATYEDIDFMEEMGSEVDLECLPENCEEKATNSNHKLVLHKSTFDIDGRGGLNNSPIERKDKECLSPYTVTDSIMINSSPEAEAWKSTPLDRMSVNLQDKKSSDSDVVKKGEQDVEETDVYFSQKDGTSVKRKSCVTVLDCDMSSTSSPKEPNIPFRRYTDDSRFRNNDIDRECSGNENYDRHLHNYETPKKNVSPGVSGKQKVGKLRLGKQKKHFKSSQTGSVKISVGEIVTESNGRLYPGEICIPTAEMVSSETVSEKSNKPVCQTLSFWSDNKFRGTVSTPDRESEHIKKCMWTANAEDDESVRKQDFLHKAHVSATELEQQKAMTPSTASKPFSTPIRPFSTPIRPFQKNFTPEIMPASSKDVLSLTPIKGSPNIVDDEDKNDDSEDSFIIRRRKRPAVLMDNSSTTDISVEKTPQRPCKNRKTLTLKQSDSSAVDDNSKSRSSEKKRLSILDAIDDDLDDFEDGHSVMMPQKPALMRKDTKKKKLKKGTGFIEKEAEVSGEEASSDEEEIMDDYYECSFIDNNTEMTQTQGIDMRALYLKSVKSPPVGAQTGHFKLQFNKNRNHDIDVFSQTLAEDHGMSDYEEDSFCVGSEEEDISYEGEVTPVEEYSKRVKKKSKDKKQKPAPGKKRIKMMAESSSDEEQGNKIQMTQEFSAQYLKAGRKVLFSSSEDESERKSCRTSMIEGHGNDNSLYTSRKGKLVAAQTNHDTSLQSESADQGKQRFAGTFQEKQKSSESIEASRKNVMVTAIKQQSDFSDLDSVPPVGNFNLFDDDDDIFEELAVPDTNFNHETTMSSLWENKSVQNDPVSKDNKFLSLKNGSNKVLNNANNLIDKVGGLTNAFSVENQHIHHKESEICDKFESRNGQPSHLQNQKHSPNFSRVTPFASKSSDPCTSRSHTDQAFSIHSNPKVSGSDTNIVQSHSTSVGITKPGQPGTSMSREERLQRQREKQERFRQKLKQKQSSTNALSLDSSTAAGVCQSTSAGCSTNDNTCVPLAGYSTTDPAKMVETVSDAKVSPTFTKIVDERRSDSQLQILVDSREISGAQDIISALRLKHGIKVTARQISACDYILSNYLAADRIQWSCFSNSTHRNKLASRLCDMQALYDRCVLIVETDRPKSGQEKSKKPLHHTKYLDTTLAYIAQSRIKMYFTDNVDETAALLSDLCRVEGKKGRALTVPVSLTSNKEEMLKFILSIPRVTVPQALNLVNKYHSLAELIASPMATIEERGCMSKISAQSVHNFLRHSFDLQMMPNPKR